jgi:stearoyl-CoA desaturase (delta-9 desaturase)
MSYVVLCFMVFCFAYLLNMTYITVFYHRGLTHGAVKLSPFTLWLVKHTGIWVTGMDPLSWCCMHRMHHEYSDQRQDPHSPVHYGILGVFRAQYDNYNHTAMGIMSRDPAYCNFIKDIPWRVHWLKRESIWFSPYIMHALVGLGFAWWFGGLAVGFCYWFGMLSHPIQGWMVNSFGHSVGYRNFKIADQSRNNTFVGWTVMGEGFQNNHHAYPASARFSCRWFEFDPGWVICRVLDALGVIEIRSELLIPAYTPKLASEARG